MHPELNKGETIILASGECQKSGNGGLRLVLNIRQLNFFHLDIRQLNFFRYLQSYVFRYHSFYKERKKFLKLFSMLWIYLSSCSWCSCIKSTFFSQIKIKLSILLLIALNLWTNLRSILVSDCCYNKLPQTQWLNTAQFYFLTVLEVGNPK